MLYSSTIWGIYPDKTPPDIPQIDFLISQLILVEVRDTPAGGYVPPQQANAEIWYYLMKNLLKSVKLPEPVCCDPNAEWATAQLLQKMPLEPGDVILEPCCGDSAIAKVIKNCSHQLHVFTNDIDDRQPADFHLDMTQPESWKLIERMTGGFDWVIGSPPLASEPFPGKKRGNPIGHLFLGYGYMYARKGIVFLLRKSFTEPVSYRRQWLQSHSHEQFLELRLERITLRTKGRSNQIACDWYGWKHGHTGGFVPEYIWRAGSQIADF